MSIIKPENYVRIHLFDDANNVVVKEYKLAKLTCIVIGTTTGTHK